MSILLCHEHTDSHMQQLTEISQMEDFPFHLTINLTVADFSVLCTMNPRSEYYPASKEPDWKPQEVEQ